jgi:hypothetical protein
MNAHELKRVVAISKLIKVAGDEFKQLAGEIAERVERDDHEDVVGCRDIAASLHGMKFVIDEGVAHMRAALPPEAS